MKDKIQNDKFTTIVEMAQEYTEEELIEGFKNSVMPGMPMDKSLEWILAIHFQKMMEMKSALVKVEIVLNKVEIVADEIIELRKTV